MQFEKLSRGHPLDDDLRIICNLVKCSSNHITCLVR